MVAILVANAGVAHAQPRLARPPITHEGRIDVRLSDHTAGEVGASLILPAGVYARTSFTGAVGFSERDSVSGPEGRVEVISRFLLDPFRESRFGLSVGGGLGFTNSEGRLARFVDPLVPRHTIWRAYVAIVVDLELKKTAGWTPAVQIGLGGGTRIGIALRSSTDYWR